MEVNDAAAIRKLRDQIKETEEQNEDLKRQIETAREVHKGLLERQHQLELMLAGKQ